MGGRVCQWMAIDHPTRVRSMIQAASGSGSMGLPDYPRGLTVNAAESLITRGYKEHMWHHFQSKFFFPGAFVKAHPEILQELFQTFWDNAPSWSLTWNMSSPATATKPATTVKDYHADAVPCWQRRQSRRRHRQPRGHH